MEITNLWTAIAWVSTWKGRPRRGVLMAAIEGLQRVRAITREYKHDCGDLDLAIEYLELMRPTVAAPNA